MKTYDCAPSLTDRQVIEFCKQGFLMLESVVPDAINRQTSAYLEQHTHYDPVEILAEEWFVEHVLLNPAAAGAVRSLLGKDFALPNLMSNHRVQTPSPAQNWHRDGGSRHGPALHYLQVFYYPQACPLELGPTELLPGSHFLYSLSGFMGHYDKIRGSYPAAAPAGSIFLTVYSIWHRRSAGQGSGLRNLLKYNYWRTTAPQRDWIVDPDLDLATADFHLQGPTFRQQFQDSYDAAEMYFWLSGLHEQFRLMGGQGWPIPERFVERAYGYPLATTPI